MRPTALMISSEASRHAAAVDSAELPERDNFVEYETLRLLLPTFRLFLPSNDMVRAH